MQLEVVWGFAIPIGITNADIICGRISNAPELCVGGEVCINKSNIARELITMQKYGEYRYPPNKKA